MELKIHRFVLAELNTHRVFSRNSASSRAIPISKIIEQVKNDPAMPVFWGQNQSGMQAQRDLDKNEKEEAIFEWLKHRDEAVNSAQKLYEIGLHKQLVNRILEPWIWHYVIVTATEWNNFFAQRCNAGAQPELQAGAMAAQLAYYTSKPKVVDFEEWHLPFIQDDESTLDIELLKKVSAARCARVSYLTHEGKRDIEKDLQLYDKLANANPMHASPFEHVATPQISFLEHPKNFRGWIQMRNEFQNENVTKFIPNHPELIKKYD
jgi:thymidylate synthase ThyX